MCTKEASPDLQEWCLTAIDEASAQMLHVQLNLMEGPKTPELEAQKSNAASEGGQLFRVACSLELVSCFVLSRESPEALLNDGSVDPISLLVSDDSSTSLTASGNSKAPNAFLQLSPEVAYPLGPEVPCLRPKQGYFVLMLPDQRYYGIVFPEGYPEDALQMFENELSKYCLLCEQTESGEFVAIKTRALPEDSVQVTQTGDQPKGYMHSFADSITSGAEYVTWGIRNTSDFLRRHIESTGSSLSNKIRVEDANVHVPSPISGSVGFVKSVTPGVVYISGGAAHALTSIAGYIGSAVGSLLPSMSTGANGEVDPKSIGSGVRAVGVASARAVLNVWGEMSDVGKNLIEGTQKASVEVVKARYGPQMSHLTHNIIGIGADAYKVKANIASIGIKSLAKSSIKAAGREFTQKHVGKTGASRTIEAAPSGSAVARQPTASPAQLEILQGLRNSPALPPQSKALIEDASK